MNPFAPAHRRAAALLAAGALLLTGCQQSSGEQDGESPSDGQSQPSAASAEQSEHIDQAVEQGYALNAAGEDLPVVTMYTDYECPACGAFHPAVEEAADQLDGEVTVRVKNFPLPMHDGARPAALAVEAAAMQDAGGEYADRVYGDVEQWSELPDGELQDRFVELAGEQGLDQERFREDMGSEAARQIVGEHEAQAEQLELQGTPSFVADGRVIDLGDVRGPEDLVDAFREAAEGAGGAPQEGTAV
ncbi:thioredoxin domain-containing protein [Kocuria palustris]|uniref:DsbA family protein n=1 Tax=Kocuria palustris TaxID=71999 RepID=UPI00119EFB61|nr:thioredoxin domain-containing protein [Kocuria palustris]